MCINPLSNNNWKPHLPPSVHQKMNEYYIECNIQWLLSLLVNPHSVCWWILAHLRTHCRHQYDHVHSSHCQPFINSSKSCQAEMDKWRKLEISSITECTIYTFNRGNGLFRLQDILTCLILANQARLDGTKESDQPAISYMTSQFSQYMIPMLYRLGKHVRYPHSHSQQLTCLSTSASEHLLLSRGGAGSVLL